MTEDEGIFPSESKGLVGISLKYLKRMHREDIKLMMSGPYPDGRIERVRQLLFESIEEEEVGANEQIMKEFVALVLHFMSTEPFMEGVLNRTLDKMDVNLDVK